MFSGKMKLSKLRAIGIDLGTTNSALTKIVCDPASKQTHKIIRQGRDRSCQLMKD